MHVSMWRMGLVRAYQSCQFVYVCVGGGGVSSFALMLGVYMCMGYMTLLSICVCVHVCVCW